MSEFADRLRKEHGHQPYVDSSAYYEDVEAVLTELQTALAEVEALRVGLMAVSADGKGECWCGEYCHQTPPRAPRCIANRKLLGAAR